jgi:hypothetical protein
VLNGPLVFHHQNRPCFHQHEFRISGRLLIVGIPHCMESRQIDCQDLGHRT